MILIFIFPKIQSYISNKLASPACYKKALALCGRMIKPPALNIRSIGADEAGTHKAQFATLKRAGYSSDFSFQKSKIFERNTIIVKTSSKYFLSCILGVGFVLLVVSRLFIYFVKMFVTS